MFLNFILAHRNSTRLMTYQVNLIRKFFKANEGTTIKIYGFVDGDNKFLENMRYTWNSLNVEPIEIPNVIDDINRSLASPSVSFGLAANYVYEKYIKNNDNDIFILIENDVFPFKEINIEEYVKNYEMCGEIRFNPATFPERFTHFWLGFLIFNKKLMKNSEIFGCRCLDYMPGIVTDKTYWVDCGAETFYWIQRDKEERKIKQIKTVGSGGDDYDPFVSDKCIVYNIKTDEDIEKLPEIFRKKYQNKFGVLVYEDFLIHLERLGKQSAKRKMEWWDSCYQRLMSI